MIKINKIEETYCHLFHEGKKGSKNIIGVIGSLFELNDVRIQIKNKGLKGYYIIWCDEKYTSQTHRIDIYSNGGLSDWPEGFYDLIDKQVDKLTQF